MNLQNKSLIQGMTEHIIVALIAVAAIAAFPSFGQTIRNQTSANNAATEGTTVKGLDRYNNENAHGGGGGN